MTKTVTANMLDAKTRLSSLVDQVERGEVDEVILARGGRPAARLVPLARKGRIKLGLAKGRIQMPDDTSASDESVLALLAGPDAPPP